MNSLSLQPEYMYKALIGIAFSGYLHHDYSYAIRTGFSNFLHPTAIPRELRTLENLDTSSVLWMVQDSFYGTGN